MYCGKCGTPIPNGDSFCSNCGSPISQGVNVTTVNTYPRPVPPTAPNSQPRLTVGRVFEAIFLIAFAILVIIFVLWGCYNAKVLSGY